METYERCKTLRHEVNEHGFAVVPGALQPATVAQLISAIDAALHDRPDSQHAMRHLAQTVPAVRKLAAGDSVRTLVESVLSPNAFLVRSIFFDKTPEANWKVAWHQDLTIAVKSKIESPGFTAWSVKDGSVHVQPPVEILDRMLTVRLHLDDCGTADGPLQVIPGSHKSGRLNSDQISTWRSRDAPVICEVALGGALLMRPAILHASSSATEPKHRRVLHLEFAAEPLPPPLEWLGCDYRV